MNICLYQPEIPHNTGALLRLMACWNGTLHVIEPCGFVWDDKRLRRSAMDYQDKAVCTLYPSWKDFLVSHKDSRFILVDTIGESLYTDFQFSTSDILIMGKESQGFPSTLWKDTHASVRIPMQKGMRSLNLALSAAIVAGEYGRQCGVWNG